MRRRFPYKFKTIEHYDSLKNYYLKKLIKVDDRSAKYYYYHHRNDNLIYRCHLIGKKVFEKFKGNPDRLIYRSVTLDSEGMGMGNEGVSYPMEDKNYSQPIQYKIKKMTQQYEDDPKDKSEDKIRKIVFNLSKDVVLIYYHYKEGQIFRKPDKIRHQELFQSKEMNEKEGEKSEGESRQQ